MLWILATRSQKELLVTETSRWETSANLTTCLCGDGIFRFSMHDVCYIFVPIKYDSRRRIASIPLEKLAIIGVRSTIKTGILKVHVEASTLIPWISKYYLEHNVSQWHSVGSLLNLQIQLVIKPS